MKFASDGQVSTSRRPSAAATRRRSAADEGDPLLHLVPEAQCGEPGGLGVAPTGGTGGPPTHSPAPRRGRRAGSRAAPRRAPRSWRRSAPRPARRRPAARRSAVADAGANWPYASSTTTRPGATPTMRSTSSAGSALPVGLLGEQRNVSVGACSARSDLRLVEVHREPLVARRARPPVSRSGGR